MPKEIKEIYQNPTTGDVTVEYSDDSTKKFNIADTVTAVTDTVTGALVNINAPASRIRAVGLSGESRDFPLTHANLPAGYTVATQRQFPAHVEALQLLFTNQNTSAGYAVSLAGVVQCDSDMTTTGIGTPVMFSSLPTLSAASGSGADFIPTFGETDVVAIPSYNSLNLFQVRAQVAAAASAVQLPANYMDGYVSKTGRLLASKASGADIVTGWPALTSYTRPTSQWWFPQGVRAYYSVPSRTLAVAGDSIDRGFLTVSGQPGIGQGVASAITSSGFVLDCANYAIASQTHAASMSTARNVISTFKPDAILLKCMSYNSGASTADVVSSQWADFMRTVDYACRYGVQPILVTQTPVNSWTGDSLARLKQQNAKTLSLRSMFPVIDTYSAVVDPANDGKWVSGESPDGIHPGDAAMQRMIAAATPIIKAALYV